MLIVIDSGLVALGECRESRGCSRDTYPESYITKYTGKQRIQDRTFPLASLVLRRRELSAASSTFSLGATPLGPNEEGPIPPSDTCVTHKVDGFNHGEYLSFIVGRSIYSTNLHQMLFYNDKYDLDV